MEIAMDFAFTIRNLWFIIKNGIRISDKDPGKPNIEKHPTLPGPTSLQIACSKG